MDIVPVWVGLDYHQVAVQVCVLDKTGRLLANRRCENDWLAIQSLAESHGQVKGVAIEACTGAADLAEELGTHAGWSVDLAHPGYVRRMKQSPDKTDWSDARVLADLERVGYLPRVWLAPEEIRELRRVVRYRQQLANERRNIKLRVTALLRDQRIRSAPGRRWTLVWQRWLSETAEVSEQSRWIIDQHLLNLASVAQRIGQVEERLAAMTRDDVMVRHLLKCKGIGPVTAWTIRAEVGRFERFRTGKQLSRFCGLSPCNASSGGRQADAGLIQAGNRSLRATLMETAHRLMRQDERWRGFAESLERRGKPRCLVVAAVANRWVRWLYHQMQPENLAA
jgi:transposase